MCGQPKPLSVELFCGAGGLALGLAASGIRTVYANDYWEPARRSISANLQPQIVCGSDARDLTAGRIAEQIGPAAGMVKVVAGGPPCQGFTTAGRRSSADPRNSLVAVFACLAAALAAEWVVFENVAGFLTMDSGAYVLHLLDPLIEAGYMVRVRKVDMARYGVAQHRKRVVAVARLGADPGFPPLLDAAALTVDAALAGLGPSVAGAPSGHVVAVPGPLTRMRIAALKPGQTTKDLPPRLQPPGYGNRARRRVCDGTLSQHRGGPPTGLRRLAGDEPARTVTASARAEFVHPRHQRLLTVRECARLQGFPDDFTFAGSPTQQCQQIANAVPPPFAHVLGDWIVRQADEPPGACAGGLLEFDPGPATARSPALRAAVERVVASHPVLGGG